MNITRRTFGLTAAAAALGGFPAIVRASDKPIKIGWITQLTGNYVSVGHGFNVGMQVALAEVNAAGGALGRQLDVIVRDTASDPSKAVSAVNEVATRDRVDLVWGPTSSGESLAAAGVMARHGLPNLTPGLVDDIIDEEKYPNIFRLAPKFSDTLPAIKDYIIDRRGWKKVAIIADTTAVGDFGLKTMTELVKEAGGEVVYSAQVDLNHADLVPDITRAKNAGAEVVVPWCSGAGLMARMLNARADIGWDAPFAGHPAIGSGEVSKLLASPANWENAYAQSFRNVCFDSTGQVPERMANFIKAASTTVDLSSTVLYWAASGYDGIYVFKDVVERAGGTDREALLAAMNSTNYTGVFSQWVFTPENHNGFNPQGIVMAKANSLRSDGALELAPGYE